MALTITAAVVIAFLFSDAVATAVLFVLLTPAALAASVHIGMFMLMLGDGSPKSRVSHTAIMVAVIAPTVGTLVVQVVAVVLAIGWSGRAFPLPLLAAVASALWCWSITAAAAAVVKAYR
ncbi:hypothetical protein BJP25_17765 [Actinokineospora bangkokensis]|uniref:Uncharacterized protein n=1 Tax=Actinokineospora bangkokensis TaxID=1193682 RepID=A0A1Q9LMQ8_9PSEU|nr:hypothetical protein BJP25_17765 [Actinokineospora bangkokensis]